MLVHEPLQAHYLHVMQRVTETIRIRIASITDCPLWRDELAEEQEVNYFDYGITDF